MKNERDIEFTPSPTLGGTAQDVNFTPAAGLDAPTTAQGFQTQGGATQGGQAQGGSTIDQARDRAQQLVSSAAERATEQVQTRLDDQKNRAADSLSSVADSLRNSGRQFQGAPDGLTRYINQAADRVEDLAHYLHDRDVGEIVEEVEDFARRQPTAFLGGAFALGLLGARFLKSSRSNLVRHGVQERWDTHRMTSRVDNPERDAVGRPTAPGYAPPSERATSEYKAAGPRE